MSIDKEDDDYEGSYWEYLDAIIDYRKTHPEPILPSQEEMWRDVVKIVRKHYGEDLIQELKKRWRISEI